MIAVRLKKNHILLSKLKAIPYLNDFQRIIGGRGGEKLVSWKYYVDILLFHFYERGTHWILGKHTLLLEITTVQYSFTLVLEFY